MFVREKKNKSGTVSVQIIDKSSGSYRVAQTVVSSPDPEEIAFDYTKSVLGGKISVVFYDMTTLRSYWISSDTRSALQGFGDIKDYSSGQ